MLEGGLLAERVRPVSKLPGKALATSSANCGWPLGCLGVPSPPQDARRLRSPQIEKAVRPASVADVRLRIAFRDRGERVSLNATNSRLSSGDVARCAERDFSGSG